MASDIAFAPGNWNLTRAGRAKLDEIAPSLSSFGGKITVYGYTDNAPIGAALRRRGVVDNLDLSSRRAATVVRYLTSKGVNPSNISAKGRDDTHPLAPNDTPDGRAQNRRIEVVTEQPA
jgi:chemotaxis protein MotB